MRLFYVPMGKSKPASIEKTEAADGGWGIDGTAFGREEFAALLA